MRRLIAKIGQQGFTPLSFVLTVVLPTAAAIVLGTALIVVTASAGAAS
ncbi:hypothetical protein [Blastomonas sp.]|nr:hypothetical protein [Blastomonas sp.]